MNATEKNLAVARGEALAAQLMASAALSAMLVVLPNRLDALGRIPRHRWNGGPRVHLARSGYVLGVPRLTRRTYD
jgi:hypothetical protein